MLKKNREFIGVLICLLMFSFFFACSAAGSDPDENNLGTEPGQMESGQQDLEETDASQIESGQVEQDHIELGQVESGQSEPGQPGAGQVQSDPGQSGAGQVQSVQIEPGQRELGQLESSRVQSAQLESGQVELGQTCKISIVCNTVLDNMDKLAKGKKDIIPTNGIILQEREVELKEGESAFDVLQRVAKGEKIHMEHSKTPLYKSAYIEGINNLYEFDCGELSGWMYQVNGEFPPYGSSNYVMQSGDVLVWVYTCDLGQDIGGSWDSQNQ